jgi:hypothetical protein
MKLEFKVTADVTKMAGPFVNKDEIREEIRDAIQNADPVDLEFGNSEYTIDDWTVEDA